MTQRQHADFLLAALMLAAAGGGACTGAAARPDDGVGPMDTAPGAGDNRAHESTARSGHLIATACVSAGAPSASVRRLSRVEYQNTVADLLPFLPADTALPPARDLPIHGFENNVRALNPTSLLVEQWSENAQNLAALAVTLGRAQLLPCDPDAAGTDSAACGRAFVEHFGRRAFRRPLTPEEAGRYAALFELHRAAIDFSAAMELTMQAFLQAPQFLHRLDLNSGDDARIPLDGYALASRLSYFFWQSMPDAELLDAAGAGSLAVTGTLRAQIERMLRDPRAARAFGDLQEQWFEHDHLLTEERDPALYPEWTPNLAAALVEESRLFVETLWREDRATVHALMTGETGMVTASVASLYGVPNADAIGTGWVPATLPTGQRPGLLTRGAFLASHARATNGSPPLRGVAVLRKLLCREPPSPPNNADTTQPMNTAGEQKTNRELFETRTSPPVCLACHRGFDGFGFAFESYDAIGRFRSTENGQPIDTSAKISGTEDLDGDMSGAGELVQALASSGEVKRCIATNVYRRAFGRDENAADQCAIDALARRLGLGDAQAGRGAGDLKALLVDVATSDGFRSLVR